MPLKADIFVRRDRGTNEINKYNDDKGRESMYIIREVKIMIFKKSMMNALKELILPELSLIKDDLNTVKNNLNNVKEQQEFTNKRLDSWVIR